MSKSSHAKWFQRFEARAEARVRLFCFPHGGGGVQAYHKWHEELPETIDVVAIALPGRGARYAEAPIDDMRALTRGLVDALPAMIDRPFAFFGHSVGALLAFETARALRANRGPMPLHLFLSAYAAPGSETEPGTMHTLSDDDLWAAVTGLGLLPDDAAVSDELRSFALPPLRADFRLAETWQAPPEPPLPCPIMLLGGSHDPIVPKNLLIGWSATTSAGFETVMFDGGHFFTEDKRVDVLAKLARTLEGDLAALLPSVAAGLSESYPLERCLHDLFRDAADLNPDAIACHGIDKQMTFAEIDRDSDLLAAALIEMGVMTDKVAAILMPTSVDFVIALLGILKAGGAYLPLDPVTPDAVLRETLATAKPVCVITTQELADRANEDTIGRYDCVAIDGDWREKTTALSRRALSEKSANTGPESLAYCVMTSGTTGKPKGIVCPHKGAVNSYFWRFQHLPYGDDEREACNVFFVWEVLRPLLQGRPAFIIPDDVIFDPHRVVAFLGQHEITRVLFTPSLLEQILNSAATGIATNLAKLRIIYLNGEVVSGTLVQRCKALLPHVRIINDYSISECHDVATGEIGTAETFASTRVPSGEPMGNVRVYVLGDELQPLPWGVPGEVYVAGPTLARGYLNQPELTAERFLPDPLQSDGACMFRTGDVGRLLDDGQIEILGRAKFMIKLRGYSVVPAGVESILCQHANVGAAAVQVVDDDKTGQPDHIVAYVAPRAGDETAVAASEVRAFAKSRLPHYAVPARIEVLPTLPVDAATGKLDRKQLAKLTSAPAAKPNSGPDVARMGRLSEALAHAWQKCLGTAPRYADDNFFDLGGHSLKAVELVSDIEARLGLRLNVVELYEHPTFAGFSQLIASRLNPTDESRQAVRIANDARGSNADVAVIGMACRLPGADNPDELWRNIVDGVESLTEFTSDDLRARGLDASIVGSGDYIATGAVLNDVDLFDPAFFGISEREATLMDPQQRLFLQCCWHAMEDACLEAGDDGTARTGVFAGCYLPSYLIHHLGARTHLDTSEPTTFHLAEIGNDKDYLATRIAYYLNLTGPAVSVQTSCSTGLAAIVQAVASIRAGQCNTAIAGASSITFPQGGYRYVEGHVNSRTGRCRAFDAQADGTVLGDGVGAVVLKRLDRARADGDNVLAIIKGVGLNNDGATRAGYSAPGVRGQSDVIAMALDDAGVSADTIGYVEAHGTGTLIGDPIEVSALSQAFRRDTEKNQYCALGSIKPNIGHANIAAGVAGFIKAVQALSNSVIPPLINFDAPNPALELERSPFYITSQKKPWAEPHAAPRRAGVSSFGIGGTNAHVILEQAPEQTETQRVQSAHVLSLSAKSAEALTDMRDNLSAYLAQNPDQDLGAVATTLQVGRRHFNNRLAVTARNHDQAITNLKSRERATDIADVPPGGVAFIFPGQGSQHAGMAASLYRAHADFATHFDDCADRFAALTGNDIRSCFDPETAAGLLAQPDGLQPAMFAVEYALSQTLMGWGVRPSAVAGHSLGEYVAATVARVLTLDDAVALVAARSIATATCPPGAMASLATDEQTATKLIAQSSDVTLAAVNSPRDVVVSGPVKAIDAFEKKAIAAGILLRRVPVDNAFHSALMQPAADKLDEVAADVAHSSPTILLASNLTGVLATADDYSAGTYWARQMLGTVRFADNLSALLATQPSAILEVGPGRVLSRFARQATAPDGEQEPRIVATMRHPGDAGTDDCTELSAALGAIWELGCDIDWQAASGGRLRRRARLPAYPFARRRCWPDNDAMKAQSKRRPAHETMLPADKRFFIPSWRRALAPVPNGETDLKSNPRWLVLLEGGDDCASRLGANIAEGLEAEGVQLARIYRKTPSSDKANAWHEAVDAVREEIEASSADDLRIVCLWSLSRADENAQTLTGLLKHIAVARTDQQTAIWAIGTDGVAVADEPLHPETAALVGPFIVASQEHPTLAARYVDVVMPTNVADAALKRLSARILAECNTPTPRVEPIVALRGSHRFVEAFEQVRLPDTSAAISPTNTPGTYIITGGLGRIGLALASHLCKRGARVIVTSRKPFPQPHDWSSIQNAETTNDELRWRLDRLRDIAGLPGELHVEQTDVANAGDVERLLRATYDRFGTIDGLFHAAGNADLKYLSDIDAETFTSEFRSKIDGAQNIATAIEIMSSQSQRAPRFVVAFSSLAAILGGLGMSAYTAANRAMDALCANQNGKNGVRWLTINWDDWRFSYDKQQVAAYEKTRASFAMPPADGLAALDTILGQADLDQVFVATTDIEHRARRWLDRREPQVQLSRAEATADSDATVAEYVSSTPDCLAGFEALVHKAYTEILGSRDIDLDDDFFALGGDSLLATEIVLALSPHLSTGTQVKIADVFDHPTIRALAAWLSSGPCESGPVADAAG